MILVTGGNTGIGYETVKQLLLKNAKVYLAARSASKAEAAIESLRSVTGRTDIHFLQLDLADLHSVKHCAAEFAAKEQRLDLLFNSGCAPLRPPQKCGVLICY